MPNAVDSRATSSLPTSTSASQACSPRMRWQSSSTVALATCSAGMRTVVSDGIATRAMGRSPKPQMPSSPGTSIPRRWQVKSAPMAGMSLVKKALSQSISPRAKRWMTSTPSSICGTGEVFKRRGSIPSPAITASRKPAKRRFSRSSS
ncbi:hypothetical protein D3C84_1000170 [compost metagenome]